MRLPITMAVLLSLCATAQAQREPYYEDRYNGPAVIDFPSPPSETGNIKLFATTTPVSIVGRPSLLDPKGETVLGKILSSRIALTKNPEGSVQLVFERVSLSGEHEGGQDGYFTGTAQSTMYGQNLGGLSWIIEVYDATNTKPIYRWDWNAEGLDHEEVKCGMALKRISRTMVRGSALSPQEIFQRAAKVRAIVTRAEWTHC